MAEGAQVSPLKAAAILAATVVVSGGFIALNLLCSTDEFWAGFIFLIYWAMAEGITPATLPKATMGSLVGLATASLLFLLPVALGQIPGLLVALSVILFLIYGQILGRLPTAINMGTMLFLTIATIPHIVSSARYPEILVSLLLGIAYFGGLAILADQVSKRLSKVAHAHAA